MPQSKCPDLSEILPPILVHLMPYRLSTKQILYINHYETPCSVNKDMEERIFGQQNLALIKLIRSKLLISGVIISKSHINPIYKVPVV